MLIELDKTVILFIFFLGDINDNIPTLSTATSVYNTKNYYAKSFIINGGDESEKKNDVKLLKFVKFTS